VDLTIARGLDYYTGTVYETVLTDHPEVGSVCSGGRYDNLAEFYCDRALPGVGISIGVTRLFYVLQEQQMLSDELITAPAEAVVIPMGDVLDASVAAATVLRAAGIRTQVYFENKKFKQKIGYADKSGIPFAVLIGENEANDGKVAVKDMRSGEQLTLSAADAAAHINAALGARRAAKLIRG
ncbi:MAG: ATP phosphoribosyltransferase regulatory subunit, partial [Oscillospiraceae bacterium]|nr:ATP phosphoribosyltransferase regulatory subunit [Oscillospiraceae bacterium]